MDEDIISLNQWVEMSDSTVYASVKDLGLHGEDWIKLREWRLCEVREDREMILVSFKFYIMYNNISD